MTTQISFFFPIRFSAFFNCFWKLRMSLCLVTSFNSWLELIICRYRILFSLTVSIYCPDRHFLEQQKLKWSPISPNLSRLALGCGPPSGLSQIPTEPLGQPQVKVKLLELFWVCSLERTCSKWPRIYVWFECTTFKTKISNWLTLRDLRLFHLSSPSLAPDFCRRFVCFTRFPRYTNCFSSLQ